MSTLTPEFQRFQYAFTSHIRNPKVNLCPRGIESQRMRIYRRLVYQNIESFLLPCFPVLRKMLGERRWARLVRGFLAGHRSRSPFFRQIPEEFVQFLQTDGAVPATYPEFVLELAHYEWIELALATSTDTPHWAMIDPAGSLLEQRPILNPVLANLRYGWPVHRIAPRARVTTAETYLLVFRDARDQVQFTEINALTSRLVHLLESAEHTGRAALEIITEEARHPSPEVVLQGGLKIMRDLQARGALLGVFTGPVED
jgi:hypothetical protein